MSLRHEDKEEKEEEEEGKKAESITCSKSKDLTDALTASDGPAADGPTTNMASTYARTNEASSYGTSADDETRSNGSSADDETRSNWSSADDETRSNGSSTDDETRSTSRHGPWSFVSSIP